jgi:hypothetical protein
MDLDSTGDIRADELKLALKSANFNTNDEEIEAIIKEVDYDGDRIINYTEFLSSTICVKEILTEQRLMAIFRYFDKDSTGHVTEHNIQDGLTKMGFIVSNKSLKEIMEKHDLKNNGSLTLDEFRLIFHSIA